MAADLIAMVKRQAYEVETVERRRHIMARVIAPHWPPFLIVVARLGPPRFATRKVAACRRPGGAPARHVLQVRFADQRGGVTRVAQPLDKRCCALG
ncbi:hypothetical protein D3C73_1027610 [compost metagenome]